MKNKKIILALICFALVLVLFIVIYTTTRQKSVIGEKSVQIEVVLTDESKTTFQLQTNQEYLRAALDEISLIDGQEGDYGIFVTTVNSVVVNEANQEWWCLTKGGEMVTTSFDQTPIFDGDCYEITLTVGW